MSIPKNTQKPNFGNHEGVWEYRDTDNKLLGYVARYAGQKRKFFSPFTYQNGEWVKKWWDCDVKPIYNAQLCKEKNDSLVLICEGEKTADAASQLFPDYWCVTWMGGGNGAKKADLTLFRDRYVCLWPDNDEPGYKAMRALKKRLKEVVAHVGMVDPKKLGVPKKWDLADFDTEQCEVDLDMLKMAIEDSRNQQDKATDIEIVPTENFPLLTEKKRIVNTYENLEYLLNFYGIIPRFNELRKEIEADIPHKNFTKANEAKLLLAEVISLCNKNGVPRIDIPSWLMMIADKNAYNPVWEYITSKPWDGICRKQEFFNTIKTDRPKHRDFILERWMRGAVATGISKNGLAHHGVLTLLGDTGNGKSAWVKKLIPEDLNLLMGDYIFNPHNTDDRIIATKFWITELSEVAGTVSRADHNALKGFLTCKIDTYRCPYDRANTEAPRKTAFIATVNDSQFLRDDTGNRRWWVIETNDIDYAHTLDMQQVWAQFKSEYDNGEIYYLTREEINQLHEVNEQYRPETSIYEAIMERYQWHESHRTLTASATQVLQDCNISHSAGNNAITKEANRALKKITGKKPKKIMGVFKYELPRLNPLYDHITSK